MTGAKSANSEAVGNSDQLVNKLCEEIGVSQRVSVRTQKGVILRERAAKSSSEVGRKLHREELAVPLPIELARTDSGATRIRTSDGWTTLVTSAGARLVTPCSGELQSELEPPERAQLQRALGAEPTTCQPVVRDMVGMTKPMAWWAQQHPCCAACAAGDPCDDNEDVPEPARARARARAGAGTRTGTGTGADT